MELLDPTAGPRAWVLNLDAEHELAAGRRYAPTRHVAALVERESARLIGALVRPGDVVVTEEGLRCKAPELARAAGLPGLAWSPTPRARSLLERAGACLAPAPGIDILRRVNARPFAATVRAPLSADSFAKLVVCDLDAALSALGRRAPLGWLVRRTFGAAGRGRRRLAAGRPDAAERAWLVASLRQGPLTIEPWVEVTREFTRCAWVTPGGRLLVSAPCLQATTRQGAWTLTERAPAGSVTAGEDECLEEAVRAAGAALAGAGYHGPFGIDAYRHRTDGGGEVLNPLSEINARFTMDWTVAIDRPPQP